MDFPFEPPLVWFLLGVGFLVLEALIPGVFLLFFGLGAWGAALAAWAEVPLTAQVMTFITVSLVSLILLRNKLKQLLNVRSGRGGEVTEDPVITSQYLGKEVTVIAEADQVRPALVEFNGSNWQARGEDDPLRLGDRVRVVGREGLTLVVSKKPPA